MNQNIYLCTLPHMQDVLNRYYEGRDFLARNGGLNCSSEVFNFLNTAPRRWLVDHFTLGNIVGWCRLTKTVLKYSPIFMQCDVFCGWDSNALGWQFPPPTVLKRSECIDSGNLYGSFLIPIKFIFLSVNFSLRVHFPPKFIFLPMKSYEPRLTITAQCPRVLFRNVEFLPGGHYCILSF